MPVLKTFQVKQAQAASPGELVWAASGAGPLLGLVLPRSDGDRFNGTTRMFVLRGGEDSEGSQIAVIGVPDHEHVASYGSDWLAGPVREPAYAPGEFTERSPGRWYSPRMPS